MQSQISFWQIIKKKRSTDLIEPAEIWKNLLEPTHWLQLKWMLKLQQKHPPPYVQMEEAEEKQHRRCVGEDGCSSICWWQRAAGEDVILSLTPVTLHRDHAGSRHTHTHTPLWAVELAKRLLRLTDAATNPAAATSNKRSISSCWTNLPSSGVMAPVTWAETFSWLRHKHMDYVENTNCTNCNGNCDEETLQNIRSNQSSVSFSFLVCL